MSFSEFRLYKLGDLAEFTQGKQIPIEEQFESCENGMIRFLRIVDYTKKDEPKRYIINPGEKYIVDEEDIIMIRYGSKTAGKVVSGYAGVIANNMFKITVNECLVNKKFLLYLLSNNYVYDMLNASQSSSTMPAITFNLISKLEILLPSLEEQKAIADILSSLDDKIELNNQMNETLEEMAQALFKRWFVDFEFPNEEGKPYKSSGGEMVESELGMIPKGWNIKNLSDIVDNFDSKRIPLSKREREKREKIYPYYGAASIADYVDDFIFDGCYVLMGEDGTVIDNNGYPILQYVWGKFWVNNHAHVLHGKNYYSNEFVYLKLKSTNVQSLVTGAVQPKINQKNMNSIKIVVASKEIHIKFNQLIESIYSKYRLNIEQNDSLKQLRDSLLPKLMSGEIRVSDLKS